MNDKQCHPSKTCRWPLWLPLTSVAWAMVLTSCGGSRDLVPESSLATVEIKELDVENYDRYEFAMNGPTEVSRRSFQKGQQKIAVTVKPGSYQISLDYFEADNLIYSNSYCKGENRRESYELIAGLNQLQVPICNQQAEAVNASVTIDPVLVDGKNPNTDKSAQSFYIKQGRLYDKNNYEFIMRGVNNPHAYYRDQSFEALSTIKDMGFNTVRIVWCADTLIRAGRCDAKDIHPLEELSRILEKMRELHLVAVLNLQNATGSNAISDLNKMIDYYTKPDVVTLLNKHKDMLILNLANEWYGSWKDPEMLYLQGYKSAIGRMRDAGLNQVLMIDAAGWGQDFSSIPRYAKDLLAVDQNLIFSSHMYDVFSSAAKVEQSFATIREQKIPYAIGEFACDHYPDQPKVACDTIMKEANRGEQKYGFLGWSFTGNGSELKNLDVVSSDDWFSLSEWGEKLVNGPDGVRATAKAACIFEPGC